MAKKIIETKKEHTWPVVLGTVITLPWLSTLCGIEAAFKEILRDWFFCCAKLAGLLFSRLSIAALFDFVAGWPTELFMEAAAAAALAAAKIKTMPPL